MAKTLVLAEKPSVGRDLAKVLKCNQNKGSYIEGNNYVVTWALGHLVGLQDPEDYDDKYKQWSMETLPMLPEPMKLTILKKTAKQYHEVKKQLFRDDINEIVIATDAGREGELVGRWILEKAGVKKPVKRLWISSQTDKAIKDGFNNLKPGSAYQNLYKAAVCRAEADWIVGLNITRALTCKYNAQLSAGRVQSPTLAMIVQREDEIKNFVPKDYYTVSAKSKDFSLQWTDKNNNQRTFNQGFANDVLARIKGNDANIVDLNESVKKKYAPNLYDLTELQRDGNKKYGYTAEQTLEAAQNLYEKYKLTTYPRTDSRYLSNDMKPKLNGLLLNIKQGYKEAESCIDKVLSQKINTDKRVIDDKKITDHHAIIVTDNIRNLERIKLPEKERNILKLVITRFIVALDKKQEYEQTDIELVIENENFKARGKKITVPGWKETEDILLGKAVNTDEEDEKEITKAVKKNDKVNVEELKLLEKKTSSPKLYNEATLLTAMETAGKQIEDEELRENMKSIGLGTPATRAGIIEKLVSVGYIKRNKKNLVPTENGIKLIELVPEKLKKPDLTGEWEQSLNKITSGDEKSQNFIVNIKKYVYDIINEGKRSNLANVSFTGNNLYNSNKEVIGICPKCGQSIFESEKGFYCSGFRNYPKCNFGIWKSDKVFVENNINLTKEMAKELIENGKTNDFSIKLEDGSDKNISINMQINGRYVNFNKIS